MSDPALPDTQHLARVADLWGELVAAAHAGDRQAQCFLRMFGPWAAAQLAQRQLS